MKLYFFEVLAEKNSKTNILCTYYATLAWENLVKSNLISTVALEISSRFVNTDDEITGSALIFDSSAWPYWLDILGKTIFP